MANLKTRTAHSLKWNFIDRIATQVLYAVTGIVLARVLTQEDFGLVGAVLIFQAFATLAVDSGFSYALIQRKRPTRLDYSTVLWFNLGAAAAFYLLLWFCAPLIARCFQDDTRLIPLTRVMCLALILNASAIVQTNRLLKAMQVKMIAASNAIGLAAGGAAGIALALSGFGAWAIVWQTLVTAAVKSLILWTTSRWRPLPQFSAAALKSYFSIGSKMMTASFLNILFQNIYSFFIGNRTGLTSLGYYTQSDKWSKMGISSITQTVTSSFLPALSAAQDEPRRFAAMTSKMNRFTAYIIFPAILGLMLMAKPVFHALFGAKWDPSIILFQLLLLRGIFVILCQLYNNYILALGHGGTIVKLEALRDTAAIIALAATLPFIGLTRPGNPVYGLEIMLWGQVAATAATWAVCLAYTSRRTGVPLTRFLADMLPYLAQTLLIIPIMYAASAAVVSPWLKIAVEAAVGLGLYVGGNYFFKSRIQKEVFTFFRKGKID